MEAPLDPAVPSPSHHQWIKRCSAQAPLAGQMPQTYPWKARGFQHPASVSRRRWGSAGGCSVPSLELFSNGTAQDKASPAGAGCSISSTPAHSPRGGGTSLNPTPPYLAGHEQGAPPDPGRAKSRMPCCRSSVPWHRPTTYKESFSFNSADLRCNSKPLLQR